MKKFFYMICALILSGCGDFLEEYSQDLVVVKSVSDLDEVLLGDAYLHGTALSSFSKISYASWLNFLDDDVNMVITRRGTDKWISTKWLYGYTTWQMEVGKAVDGVNSDVDDEPWVNTYYRINIINIILDELKEIEYNTESERLAATRIQGECHFLRAQFYFFLVNLYANPYQPEKAGKLLGIPLKLTGYVENVFQRNTVEEVYRQIIDDLKLSVDALTRSPQSKPAFRASREAALLLLSRVYLYMQDWKNAGVTASEFLQLKKELYAISSLADEDSFMEPNNQEIVFSQGEQNLVKVLTAEGGDFCVSGDLYRLYEEKDYRKALFFQKNFTTDSISLNRKYLSTVHRASVSDAFTLRVAEGYLNMAEACAMQGDATANNWLNELRRYRIAGYTDRNYSGEEMIQQIRDERRKELCFEGHRWFDLRRYSVCAKSPYKKIINRIFARYNQDNRYVFDQAELYRLKADDPAYTFRIPQVIRDFHKDMSDNERNPRSAIASVDLDGNIVDKEKN